MTKDGKSIKLNGNISTILLTNYLSSFLKISSGLTNLVHTTSLLLAHSTGFILGGGVKE
jgi:hypothetical protein